MEKVATYRIRVWGELSATWSDRLEDMSITVDHSNTQGPVSTLEGRLSDQAALAGVLSTLYELHMPVISVDCLDDSAA